MCLDLRAVGLWNGVKSPRERGGLGVHWEGKCFCGKSPHILTSRGKSQVFLVVQSPMAGHRKNGRALLGSRRPKSRLTTSQTNFRPKTFFPTAPSQHATHPALSKTEHPTYSRWSPVSFPFCSTNNFSFLRQNAGHLIHQYWRECRWQNIFPWEPALCKL